MSTPRALPKPELTPAVLTLPHLPPELLMHILTYLDIPDLLALSRTSHQLRHLTLDPLLHSARLHRASAILAHDIPLRPSLVDLIRDQIYVTRTTMAARLLGRRLIGIMLNRKLGRRPGVEELVERGVLAGECFGKGGMAPGLVETKRKVERRLIGIRLNRKLGGRPSVEELVEWGVLPGECYVRGGKGVGMAPSLVGTKRRVERERVRDFLRGWVEEWRRKGCEINEREEERVEVRRLARRFVDTKKEAPRWGRRVETREAPARAKVLGLRRFWEKVGSEGGPS
ncbi:hypothetical protein L207DRAFT_519664 [Hyaloscypha variabilis F]|uniref:F-box domain-containing protein n=1 Tax=Hyaloscypha variabilis (strain UAMH 11265 / GT02V1 / F) TaxID=1149755 RepID=A0A2J6QXK4_HYAVF|nr:hypothetical protein L207DRAFT_519664 [Hyaloscypha variabilis F]